ncbi:hypothetical protein NCS57_01434600 [Fusarium keratoplasticum]|uniref:Uncharacterized protein n=1 Tax=Fusarium keratoplasticum TaxID=1328300 RepID=A0ACC0QFG7_9HYPO|nr:hypothetical protein NCS57_01434600 [Fusarium keratoplasticum]KAI8650990.1 hypothetical protein NCS57_01434600 [Fusarium keratoplasticum]
MSSNSTNSTVVFIPTFNTCDEVNEQCPVEAQMYGDYFTKSACIWFTLLYFTCFCTQMLYAWRSKAWSYGAWFGVGTAFEAMGYAARIIMCDDPWNFNAFLAQNLGLVLAPTFIAAATSIIFKHLIDWYGSEWSLFRPALLPWILVGSDMVSIAVQGTGGAVAPMASSKSGKEAQDLMDIGNGLLLGGTIFQVVNMVVCGGIMLLYLWKRQQSLGRFRSRLGSSDLQDSGKASGGKGQYDFEATLKVYIWSLVVAYNLILVRCIYRAIEMASGWGSDIMKTEAIFITFESHMILTAVALMTIFHPHVFFPVAGRGGGARSRRSVHSDIQELRPMN